MDNLGNLAQWDKPDDIRDDIRGLVLCGGRSTRMGQDKHLLVYSEISPLPQWQRNLGLLEQCGFSAFVSCRADQVRSIGSSEKIIEDHNQFEGGPGVGLLSAHLLEPNIAWLVVACDFPFMNVQAIQDLLNHRQRGGPSICYKHSNGTLEPLFALWEPQTLKQLLVSFGAGEKSPRKILEKTEAQALVPANSKTLININSVKEAQDFPGLQIVNSEKALTEIKPKL